MRAKENAASAASDVLGMNAKSIHVGARKRKSFASYELARTAANWLWRTDLETQPREQHRTCWCHRGIQGAGGQARLVRTVTGPQNARLVGVTTCGSVWTCPVCSTRIAAVRRDELQRGVEAWHRMDPQNRVFLMTFTFPHERDAIALADMVERFADAEAAFKRSRTFERILGMKGGRRAGSVRSFEVTRGGHGWHPHAHYLVFARAGLFAGAAEDDNGRLSHEAIDELRLAWCNALLKKGLCETRQVSDVMTYGLDVRGGDYAAEYIAKFGHEQKWGLSGEVTLHVAKTGVDGKGMHPFQLLRSTADDADEGGRLFREYADAFTGRRMLTWSPGLKTLLLDDESTELTDEEAAERELDPEEDVGHLNAEQLSVLHSRKGLGRLLAIVAECGTSGARGQQLINEVVDHFRRQPIAGHGVVKEKLRCRGYAYYDAERSIA